jgi:hypothetical protein
MKVREITEDISSEQEGDDLFEMANVYPRGTGWRITVWVSPRGNARHDVRVKVNIIHGNQMNISNTAVVGVRPTPRVLAGRLTPSDAQAVFQWVTLNTDTLVAYWEGRIGTIELAAALRPIPAPAPPSSGGP